MIPLDSETAILPRMPTGRAITGEFPLTIIKPPVLDTRCRSNSPAVSNPIYRILRSRRQRRNSSASSVHSGGSNKTECTEFVAERVEVFQLRKDTGQREHVESVLIQAQNQSTYTLPDNMRNCQQELVTSRQNCLISPAKERHISIQEEPLEMTSELNGLGEDTKQQCNSTDSTMETKQTDSSSVTETAKQSENLPVNKRNRKKSSKVKKTPKKRKNSVKRGVGVSGIFARLAGSHGQKQQGQQVNLNEQMKPRANLHQRTDTSPDKYLSIQKLHAAYGPKKNENKNNTAVLLPRVSNTSLTKDHTRSCTSSPRKQEQELESISISTHLSSPQKLLNYDDEKVKKIYLSETHSGMITGIPCAPPSTPTVDELKKVEYIPSLTDVKSQRAVKSRLVNLGNKMRAEEQRKKEKAIKEEQKRAYGATLQLKQRQRAEIYALNKVMTELENENFRKFMEENSAETLPV